MWYIYTMEYYPVIRRDKFESALVRWMYLDSVIQNKVSQKEKKHHILMLIYGIQKKWCWWTYLRAAIETQTENRLVDTAGKEGGTNREWHWNACVTMCETDAVLCSVAQSCPTLCHPMDCSLPGSTVLGNSPGKNTGVEICHMRQGAQHGALWRST